MEHVHRRYAGAVVVHIGAGMLSSKRDEENFDLMNRACQAAARVLLGQRGEEPDDALAAAVAAVRALEDDAGTNAGFGANLTEDGMVECDASVFCCGTAAASAGRKGSEGCFGGVAALPGVRNPVRAAAELLVAARAGAVPPLMRLPPALLVGDAARVWALQKLGAGAAADGSSAAARERAGSGSDGVGGVAGGSMFSHSAVTRWRKYRGMIAAAQAEQGSSAQEGGPCGAAADQGGQEDQEDGERRGGAAGAGGAPRRKRQRRSGDADGSKAMGAGGKADQVCAGKADQVCADVISDTVGAICIDRHGRVAAAASSGGVACKVPGRVGSAALPGHGCWASQMEYGTAVGCCTSGASEETMVLPMAAQIGARTSVSVESALRLGLERFLAGGHGGGCVLLHAATDAESGAQRLQVGCAHSTPSMGFAFMRAGDESATTHVSRRGVDDYDGCSTVLELRVSDEMRGGASVF
jgi:taspase (threonine aspartase 1)